MIDIPAWFVFVTMVFLAIVVGRTGTIVKDYFENHKYKQ